MALAARNGDLQAVRAAFNDEDPKVKVAALTALVHVKCATPADVERLLLDGDPGARRSACELAGAVPGVDVLALLDDPDPRVVEAACFAAGELEDARAAPRLAVVARSHADPLCRESAVAALGAIGEPGAAHDGRSAVLAALGDVPAIRRRAVVALAAFEGDDVDAALTARLEDRDWQVRQSAQEVLGLTDEEPR